jgi:putative transposase
MIEPNHPQLSIRRQCDLLELNRSAFYYQPATESPLNLELMRLIDAQYTKTPFYGWPRMTIYLQRQGYPINHKRVQRCQERVSMSANQRVKMSPDHHLKCPLHQVRHREI